MLKKSFFSPVQPQRAKTRLFPCVVLGSSKSSTYLEGTPPVSTHLRPSWTAFLSILREHFFGVSHVRTTEDLPSQNSFSGACSAAPGRSNQIA